MNMLLHQNKELMRRKYDKLKNELKAKLDLLKNYELEL